jgi:threonyl-tRNA synthetase
MIHRGTVGAIERLVAALLERYQGRLPLWLAPVQICVMPVGPAQDEAGHALVDALRAAGLRAIIEVEGSLGARVRVSRQRRDCVIAVIGASEVEAGEVQVIDIAADFKGPVLHRELIDLLSRSHSNRARRIEWPRGRQCRSNRAVRVS